MKPTKQLLAVISLSMLPILINAQTSIFESGGKVGIGTTSPNYKLDVYGAVVAGDGTVKNVVSYGSGIAQLGTISNHQLSILTNAVERMRFDANGNVGIGTTSPSFPLNGTVKAKR